MEGLKGVASQARLSLGVLKSLTHVAFLRLFFFPLASLPNKARRSLQLSEGCKSCRIQTRIFDRMREL